MIFIGPEQIQQSLDFPSLVAALKTAFASDIETPLRQHFDIPNPESSRETTLLMMPSWQAGSNIGVKLITVTPESFKFQLPSIQGMYVLFDAVKGSVKATMDAPALTAKRTAAASALASQFISRPDSRRLLMVGTGTLAPQLIQAHCAVRPIDEVLVWGRDAAKAHAVVDSLASCLSMADTKVSVCESLEAGVKQVDIVSVATLSQQPLILGQWLQAGQHVDLVGAYRPDMRESDNEVMQRARIVVDSYQGACKENGDIAIPLKEGIISRDDIEADLFSLCKKEVSFVRQDNDITVFKSVGHALEDLAAAQLMVAKIEAEPS